MQQNSGEKVAVKKDSREYMTPRERFEAVVNLSEPDRVPVAPLFDYFSARYAGISFAEYLADRNNAKKALIKTVEGLGGVDFIYILPFSAKYMPVYYPMKIKMPGRDLPPDSIHQLPEEEVMVPEDYQVIIEKGLDECHERIISRLHPEISLEERAQTRQEMLEDFKSEAAYWKERGIPYLYGGSARLIFSHFSMARSMAELMMDLYRRPDLLLAASRAAMPSVIQSGLAAVEKIGAGVVFMAGSREASTFISLDKFEKFAFPFMKQAVEAFAARGIISFLHLDCDWTPNLPYFKEFPKKKCIIHFDGATDIFKAKKVIGDTVCLMGDVPPSMLSFGTPSEVEAYCKKLIDVVGEGGGFILSGGCSLPADAKIENVKAMIDTAKSYGFYN